VAWVKNETWPLEQGIDGKARFELFEDAEETEAWPFPGWDVKAVLSDEKQRQKYTLTTVVDAINGVVDVIAPEALVNSLRIGKKYWLNVLMVAPGTTLADDHHLAFMPVTVEARSARRDP
jgi:hypothetical protein